jgi:probable DNA metabolism protein
MIGVILPGETDFDAWRGQARGLLHRGVPPEDVSWTTAQSADLFATEAGPLAPSMGAPMTVPRGFVELAETVILHRDPQRFARLYRVLWRLRDEPRLMQSSVDPDVAGLEGMAKAVRRDIHKMRAFVRFRETRIGEAAWFVAWFEPDHHILERNAPFFMRRFATMNWSILTPEGSAHWDGAALRFGPGGARTDAPPEDAMEAAWKGYYAAIFNPARLKISAMKSEMPMKYWRNLPEAELIAPLIARAQARSDEMVRTAATQANPRPQRARLAVVADPAPAGTIEALRAAAADCRACPLWKPATQTVFGVGPADAPVVFVGEQPGDKEDLDGRPFVGPAGQLFDRALAEAGADRRKAYVTNAVKHFKFTPRGKSRIHQTPAPDEIRACRPWLEKEIALIRPRLIVAMGATAARSVFGKVMAVGANRGRLLETREGARALITVHPSYLLRLPDERAKAEQYRLFVEDLTLAASFFDRAA